MNTEHTAIDRIREAHEVGCYGLVSGFAKQVKTGNDINAESALKRDGPFFCGACLSQAILRKCAERKDHFAHHTPLSPVVPREETQRHRACMEEICTELQKVHPDGLWEIDRPIPENKGKKLSAVRPDISGRIGGKNGQRLAIEIQASSMTIPKICKRSDVYHRRGIPILWVVPLLEPINSQAFRARLYERYFHSLYFGRVYYWWPGCGETVTPVHYGVARRYIDHREWYDTDAGEHREAGGHFMPYKIIKKPILGQPVKISKNFYEYKDRPEFRPRYERKSVPKCTIWMDKLPIWWDAEDEAKFEKYYPEEDDQDVSESESES